MSRLAGNRWSLAAALCVGLGACDEASTIAPPEGLPDVSDVAVVNTAGPIFRSLHVELDRAGEVEVFYEPIDGGRTFRMRSDSAALTHDLLLPRLLADTTYRFAVRTRGETATSDSIVRGSFTTGPLPADLADLDYEVEGTGTFPLLMFGQAAGGFDGEVAMEPDGRIVWYVPERGTAPTPIPGSHDIAMISNARDGIVRIAPDGRVVAFLPRDGGDYGGIHHDIAAVDDERILFIARDTQTIRDTTVTGEAIWEWNTATGSVEKRWSAFDHLDWATDRDSPPQPGDWLHANSLSIGPRGNVVMSLYRLNQVISISPDYQSIEWRLGGVNATVRVSEEDQFEHQHCAFELEDGSVLLFDNGGGGEGEESWSRGLGFRIEGDTAALAFEYADPPRRADIWGANYGLENGHRVVTFSAAPFTVDEVDAEGERVWRLTGPDLTVSFRAVPWPDIAGEVRVDAMP